MKYLLALCLFLTASLARSQAYDSIGWETEADYRKWEDEVLATIAWLEENPIATADNDTKAMTSFVLHWLAGTPYITVELDNIFLESLANSRKYRFARKFSVTYLLGKSYYLISHQDRPDEAAACARGIEGMVKVYEELLKADPSVKHWLLDKYARLYHNGRLAEYVRRRLEKVNKNAF